MAIPLIFRDSFHFIFWWGLYPFNEEMYPYLSNNEYQADNHKEHYLGMPVKKDDDEIISSFDLGDGVTGHIKKPDPYKITIPCRFYLKLGSVPAKYFEYICYLKDTEIPELIANKHRKESVFYLYKMRKPYVIRNSHEININFNISSSSFTNKNWENIFIIDNLIGFFRENSNNVKAIDGPKAQERFYDVINYPPLDDLSLDLLKKYVEKDWQNNYLDYHSEKSTSALSESGQKRLKKHFLNNKLEQYSNQLIELSKCGSKFEYEKAILEGNLKDFISYLEEEKEKINEEIKKIDNSTKKSTSSYNSKDLSHTVIALAYRWLYPNSGPEDFPWDEIARFYKYQSGRKLSNKFSELRKKEDRITPGQPDKSSSGYTKSKNSRIQNIEAAIELLKHDFSNYPEQEEAIKRGQQEFEEINSN